MIASNAQSACGHKRLRRDLRTLVRFVEVYCRGNHPPEQRAEVELKTHGVQELTGRQPVLCPDCAKLLTHALVKRSHCPMNPKPACKHCPRHCYHPHYRQQIRRVMKYSGMKMLLGGRLDYLFHLFF